MVKPMPNPTALLAEQFADVAASRQDTPGVEATVYEYVGRIGTTGPRTCLARIRRGDEPGGTHGQGPWVLSLLPDNQGGPLTEEAFRRANQWATKAHTAQEAQRVVQRAGEAVQRFLEARLALQRSFDRELAEATSATGAVQDPLL